MAPIVRPLHRWKVVFCDQPRPGRVRMLHLCQHCQLLTHAPGRKHLPRCDRRQQPAAAAEPIRWANVRRPRAFPFWRYR